MIVYALSFKLIAIVSSSILLIIIPLFEIVVYISGGIQRYIVETTVYSLFAEEYHN